LPRARAAQLKASAPDPGTPHGPMDAPATNAATTPDTRLQQRRRTWLIALTAGVVVVALLVTAWWWLYASRYEGTDDAYVAGDLANVMSQVSGTVISIGADENDRVLAGEELLKLDPTDTRIALQDQGGSRSRARRFQPPQEPRRERRGLGRGA